MLQFTTAWIITLHDSMLLQFTTGALLQFTTLAITFHDRYYNTRQVHLQFATVITIHDIITFHDTTGDAVLHLVDITEKARMMMQRK